MAKVQKKTGVSQSDAEMMKLVDIADLNPAGQECPCGFDSHSQY